MVDVPWPEQNRLHSRLSSLPPPLADQVWRMLEPAFSDDKIGNKALIDAFHSACDNMNEPQARHLMKTARQTAKVVQ
jgi:hypothetical protein